MHNQGTSLARLRERFICRNGTRVTLNTGVVLRALIKHSDNELLRTVTSDDTTERQPVVFVFGPGAWGQVIEGMTITVGGTVTPRGPNVPTGTDGKPLPVDMGRKFRVADPLHPKWRSDVVTELSVVAYPC